MTFLITGAAHSGTGWMSRFFTELGYRCGHERWFNLDRQHLGGSDSSWLAAPHVFSIDPNVPVIHLVRDPLKVVRSYFRSGEFLHNTPYDQYAERYLPGERTRDEKIIHYVETWDILVEAASCYTFRIEDSGDLEQLCELVHVATGDYLPEEKVLDAASRVSPLYNSHVPHMTPQGYDISWDKILKISGGDNLLRKARFYGYDVEQ